MSYVSVTQKKNTKLSYVWFLAMKCTGGKIYLTCMPKNGQQMCGSASVPPESDEECIEGCYCPEGNNEIVIIVLSYKPFNSLGTVLHDNKCITKDQCPCRLRGKNFSPGASIPKDCNTCTCSNGEWECTQV